MICENCQTTLPAEAIACWKCGKPLTDPAQPSSVKKGEPDLLIALVTFGVTVALFVCMGWSIPFTVWGKLNSIAAENPQWSNVLGIVSAIAFVVATIGFIGGVWWGAYWLITRATAKPSAR